METLLKDTVYRNPHLLKAPSVSIVATSPWSLGIGGKYRHLYRRQRCAACGLPFAKPEQLMMVWESDSNAASSGALRRIQTFRLA